MPDIAMCRDIACPKATRCWRFMARSSAQQCWFAIPVRVGNECEFFWRTDGAREGASSAVPSHGLEEKP